MKQKKRPPLWARAWWRLMKPLWSWFLDLLIAESIRERPAEVRRLPTAEQRVWIREDVKRKLIERKAYPGARR